MQNNSNPTQCDMILDYLKDFGEITQLDALKDLGVMRLASRVSELKRKGYAIKTTMRTAKNRYNKPTSFAVYACGVAVTENQEARGVKGDKKR